MRNSLLRNKDVLPVSALPSACPDHVPDVQQFGQHHIQLLNVLDIEGVGILLVGYKIMGEIAGQGVVVLTPSSLRNTAVSLTRDSSLLANRP